MSIVARATRSKSELFTIFMVVLTLSSSETGTISAATPERAPLHDSEQISAGETAELAWVELASLAERPPARIWRAGQTLDNAGDCYVITHGMGGSSAGDRFHQLADAIHQRLPQVRVLRIDWSGRASATIGIFPDPWKVAASIDEVGDHAAQVLQSEGIDPARTTLIGESFGNWVNARIAHRLGSVEGILALNPANEGAGYRLPDLRKHANRSWSFHTYSVFDTTCEIAESDFFLATPADASHWAQHVSGIPWLSGRIRAGDLSWLRLDKPLPERRAGHFQSLATLDGELTDQQPSRERPVPPEERSPQSNLPAMDRTVATP